MKTFQFKSFQDMKPSDYERVGFKSGLEIHQQILTNKKLFCRCPAGKYSESYDAEISAICAQRSRNSVSMTAPL